MNEKQFLNVEEVAEYLGVSVSKSYKVIRKLNDELEAAGYLTISGRISRKYFEEKVYGGFEEM